jgi:hypothetical protein
MQSRAVFVVVSAVLGAVLYLVLSLGLAAGLLQIQGSGPHGYGDFVYLVLPAYLVPIGFVSGLLVSGFMKQPRYGRAQLWLAALFAAIVVGCAVWFYVWRDLWNQG